MRESPALEITRELAKRLSSPSSRTEELPDRLTGVDNVTLTDLVDALRQADVVALLVDHREFRQASMSREGIPVVDTRGAWRTKQG